MTTRTMQRRAHKPVTLPAAKPEGVINNAPKKFEDFWVGAVSHQGDLIIVSIASLPRSAKPRKQRQLAEGNTQGSRHVLERGEAFDADAAEIADAITRATCGKVQVDPQYLGPVFTGPAYLAHPEHGHQEFPAGTTCAVVIQRNLDAEEREAAVQD